MSVIDRFQQPEYTGENRCTPCTAVNLLIAIVVSALLAIISTVGGLGVFVLSVGAIYLRGYLVPGTPTLTKRYFPERVLRWFDKDTDSTAPLGDEPINVDPERVLLDAGAVEPDRDGTDLRLTNEFQHAWRERISTAGEHDLNEEYLAGALGVPLQTNDITIERRGEAYVAHTDETVIGQWSSGAATIADVAAATELSNRSPTWDELRPAETARVLMSLRVFIEQCPECNGPVQVEQEVVESCCRSYDVIASACQDCDARLFEMEWNETVAAGSESQASPA
ncbi:hypothetical protein [Halococcus salifodinae]|uniref:Uncharacterized protein n=1 Tax=Halococcus salifodinae DSM 8989 TaxID=1227456 RepID=M0N288_9EURY|nr:hypothetical protein [Halococcus salifodinae]EMA51249.1 hypothetical protein C450_12255 [Halococcus salifodinae DSM 8989]